jgi:hypothetical protein
VIEGPLLKKMKLTKVVKVVVPQVEEAQNVANFLAARRRQMPKPSVPHAANVEAFLANEPIKVSPVNVAEPTLEESLQVVRGPIPIASILGRPLGLNIQHILEDFNFESEDSVGMKGDNMEPTIAKDRATRA